MNGEEENYHPLDIGLACYPSDDIGLPNVSDRSNEKDVTDKVPKEPIAEEANPAEIYLYDQPQMSRQDAKNRSKEDPPNVVISKFNNGAPSNSEGTDGNMQRAQGIRHGSSHNTMLLGSSNDQEQSFEVTKSKSTAESSFIDGAFPSGETGSKTSTATPTTTVTTLKTAPATSIISSNDLSEIVEQPFYVNAKQYYRILKRRYARAKLEENLRISRERKPYLHESRHKHAMRRPRGQGGRFLTIAEIEALKNKKDSTSSTPSVIDTPCIDVAANEKKRNSNAESSVINQQETGSNKLACIKKK